MQKIKISRGIFRRPTIIKTVAVLDGYEVSISSPSGRLTKEELARFDAHSRALQATL